MAFYELRMKPCFFMLYCTFPIITPHEYTTLHVTFLHLIAYIRRFLESTGFLNGLIHCSVRTQMGYEEEGGN